jgi:Tfp pilus assembly protein PilN
MALGLVEEWQAPLVSPGCVRHRLHRRRPVPRRSAVAVAARSLPRRDGLEQSRMGPVKVLDHVSQSLEPLKVWLTRLGVASDTVELEGKALTNDDVVEFVNNLRRTDYFTGINLQESKAAVENKINVYQFRLAFRLKGS